MSMEEFIYQFADTKQIEQLPIVWKIVNDTDIIANYFIRVG